MSNKVLRITPKEIEQFQRDGAICLRGVFDERWINSVRQGIEKLMSSPSPRRNIAVSDGGGKYFADNDNWRRIDEFRDYIFNSPAGEIAGRLMKSEKATFIEDFVIVKESGVTKTTPWHHDQAYFPVDGIQNCSIWTTVDPVPKQTCLRLIKGSHRWGKWFIPTVFDTGHSVKSSVDESDATNGGRIYEPMPDIEKNNDNYEVLSWDLQPGDCIVFHLLTLHGAPGNSEDVPRRTLATRWLGDDAVYGKRPWNVALVDGFESLKTGDAFPNRVFPVIWTRKS